MSGDSVEVRLRTPIQAHGENLSMLIIGRPKAKHMRGLKVRQVLEFGDLLDLAAAVTGLPPSSIDQLDAEDAANVVAAVAGFLGGSPGDSPSS